MTRLDITMRAHSSSFAVSKMASQATRRRKSPTRASRRLWPSGPSRYRRLRRTRDGPSISADLIATPYPRTTRRGSTGPNPAQRLNGVNERLKFVKRGGQRLPVPQQHVVPATKTNPGCSIEARQRQEHGCGVVWQDRALSPVRRRTGTRTTPGSAAPNRQFSGPSGFSTGRSFRL